MSKLLIYTFVFSLFSTMSFAQQAPKIEPENDPYEVAYQKRIKKTRINGVYIPKDLYDSFSSLDRLIDAKTKAQFMQMPEEKAGRMFYLIMWMTNNWSFYEGSRLSSYIRNLGITHPEHMAHFIITTYHRNLHKKKLDIGERVAFYQNKLEEEKERKKKNAEVIKEEKKVREKN